MQAKQVVIGLDTSCYTTSLAVMDLEGKLLYDQRKVLEVKPGKNGLAQSEMVFQHVRNLPMLVEQIPAWEQLSIQAIGVSKQPRNVEGSYMPAFLPGYNFARSLACIQGCALYPFTHQENHVEAALWSAQVELSKSFLVLHASGGTTEILLASPQGTRYELTIVGESIDLHAGQFIDRVGVALELPFPAGPHVEQLAKKAKEPQDFPVSVQGGKISFAGPSTAVLRAITAKLATPEMLAAGTQQAIGKALAKALFNLSKEYGVSEVLLVGGVTANQTIREIIQAKLQKIKVQTYMPEACYSRDNAVGAAAYALKGL